MELGCTFFDTALAYGNGKSEQLLAQVLARHRDKTLRVATKVPPKNLRWPALAEYPLDDVFPADHIRASTEISLDQPRALESWTCSNFTCGPTRGPKTIAGSAPLTI